FNIIMITYLGEDGVAAITIVLYAQFLLTAVYLGFSIGVGPVLSYNYGEQNTLELKKIFKMSMIFITISGICIFIFSILFSPNIVGIFVKKESTVFSIAMNGFLLFSSSYLFIGFNIFISSMFTAFSNGKVSAIISFLRTFVFIILGIALLPKLLGVDGIWLAIPFAEFLTLMLSFSFLIKLKKMYFYI
ncbi:MAG: MATE family efflux transporter, partial [Oscillospiraceae bacterium]